MASKTWHEKHREQLTFGQRVADATARRLGSWPFIIGQTILVALWIGLNLLAWFRHWDPYPFILLNLMFSVQAAYAGPVLMMSQNRQEARDRIQAREDYDTNVRAELEIAHMQEQIDRMENKLDRLTGLLKAP
jgi:uncharacterized membrane protein